MKRYWNYNRATSLWHRWHQHVCMPCRWKQTPHGLTSRKGWLWKLVAYVPLAICTRLDDWSHGKEQS